MTRIETFVAAAFAFSITMLVISLDSIPSTYDEFILAVKQIPSFIASAAIIFWIWHSHASWCRRYGLEDSFTVLMSGLLIFQVLIYIYPLRLMMQGLFSTMTGGYLPMLMEFSSIEQVRFMFAFYAIGFLLLCLIFIALYRHADKKHQQLALNQHERFDTQTDIQLWVVASSVCCISLLGSILLPNSKLVFCGLTYFLLFPFLFGISTFRAKKREKTFNQPSASQ